MAVLVTFGIILMAWYNAGSGAGVWTNAVINPTLKNVLHEICTAINEREAVKGGGKKTVSSITRSSSTATVTTSANHDLATGDIVYMRGADQTEYNGRYTITVTGATTFTYTVSGTPTTPATGEMRAYAPTTKFTYNADGDQKFYPSVSDFVGLPISRDGNGQDRLLYVPFTPTSLTYSATFVTVTTTAAIVTSLAIGDTIEVAGADQSDYNGVFVVVTKPTSTTFTYLVAGTPASPATGTITVAIHGRVTRSGSTATIHLPGHGLSVGSIVNISGTTQSDYNGFKTVSAVGASPTVSSITRSGSTATVTTSAAHGLLPSDAVIISGCVETQYNGVQIILSVPSSTTFTYSVSGSPSTPATGSPVCNNISVFQFEVSGSPASPATGSIKCTANRYMIEYATHSGSTATYWCFEHGLANGDYVEVVPNQSGYTDWAAYGAISGVTTNSFNLALTAPSSSTWTHGTPYTMHCSPEGMMKRLLREMQIAIGTLVTGGTVFFFEDDGVYSTQWTLSNLLSEGSYGSSWLPLLALVRSDLESVITQMREAVELLLVFKTPSSISSIAANTEVYTGTGPSKQDAWDDALGDSPTDFSSTGVKRLISGSGPYTATIWDNAVFSYELPGNGFGTFIEGTYDMDETLGVGATMDAFDIEDQDANVVTLDRGSSGTTTHTVTADVDVFGNNPVVEWTIIQSSIPATVPSGAGDRNAGFSGARVTRELVPGTHLTYG